MHCKDSMDLRQKNKKKVMKPQKYIVSSFETKADITTLHHDDDKFEKVKTFSSN